MLICHSCGTPVDSKSKQCHHCRSAISVHAAVGLMEPETASPLKAQLELQPRTLDNLIAADLIKATDKYISANPLPAEEKDHNGHNGQTNAVTSEAAGHNGDQA